MNYLSGLFGGIFNDLKRRFKWYLSDFVDGLNSQCFAAAIFIYFAGLSGAVAFGGLLGEKTGNLIGISETLLLSSIGGTLFALLAGAPLIIIGVTGPLLLYDDSLFGLCSQFDIGKVLQYYISKYGQYPQKCSLKLFRFMPLYSFLFHCYFLF